MTRTRIKFCGLTRAEDVDFAVAAGADAIGLVLVPRSKRALTLDAAAALRARIPPLANCVLLLQNAEAAFVREALARLKPELLQFHGGEPAEFCAAFGHPYLYALAMGGEGAAGVREQAVAHAQAAAFLLDAHAPGELGGQGVGFDWTQIPADLGKPLVLAGGLRPETVAQAVCSVRPYAVDVSSGIESSPGVKDCAKMQAFIDEVRRGDCG